MTLLQRFSIWIYALVVFLVQPLLLGYLLWRARRQPDYLRFWAHRFFGLVPKLPHCDVGQRIWVHAVSVGETHAVSPLVLGWAKSHPDDKWVFSSATPTGMETAKGLFSHFPGAVFVHLPYDLSGSMRRCISRLNANALWLVETELWPNLLRQAALVGLPVSLVNARVSPRSRRRLKRFSALSVPAVRVLHRLVCQTAADAEVFEELGRKADAVTGNLKFDVAVQPHLQEMGTEWRRGFGEGPILVFASSREGEESEFLTLLADYQFFQKLPQASVWLVPRHPQRFDSVFQQMRKAVASLGVSSLSRRSEWRGAPAGHSPLVLGDSMGEMPAYYSVADVAFLGGSFAPLGGQNLIEACAYGCPVWMGPHTFNFKLVAQAALEAGAALRFESLSGAIEQYLAQTGRVDAQFSAAATHFASIHKGATGKTLDALSS